MIHVIDWVTGLASFGVKFIGYPSQVASNRASGRAGRGAGITIRLAAAMCLSYFLWVVHGIAHHDWVEILSQGIGVFTTGFLLAQALWYRRVQARQVGEEAVRAMLLALPISAEEEEAVIAKREVMVRSAAGQDVYVVADPGMPWE